MVSRSGVQGELVTIASENGLLLDGLLFEAVKPIAVVGFPFGASTGQAKAFEAKEAIRSGAEEIAQGFCDRKGKSMRGISETDAKPPYILGNFPRVELVFECADKQKGVSVQSDLSKYEKLAALKKLLDSGTLTQQEFESEKAKILAGP